MTFDMIGQELLSSISFISFRLDDFDGSPPNGTARGLVGMIGHLVFRVLFLILLIDMVLDSLSLFWPWSWSWSFIWVSGGGRHPTHRSVAMHPTRAGRAVLALALS